MKFIGHIVGDPVELVWDWEADPNGERMTDNVGGRAVTWVLSAMDILRVPTIPGFGGGIASLDPPYWGVESISAQFDSDPPVRIDGAQPEWPESEPGAIY